MRLWLAVNLKPKFTLLIALMLVFIVQVSSQADPGSKVWVQVVLLGDNPRKYGVGLCLIKGTLMSKLLR